MLFVPIAALVLTTLVSTLAGAAALRFSGVAVPRIEFGVWSPKLRGHLAGSEISLSPWLFSGATIYKDFNNADIHDAVPGRLFGSLGRTPRALIALAGPAAVLACAAMFAGADVFGAFMSAFAQIARGAMSPFGYAQELLVEYWQLAESSPAAGIGIALAKFSAFMLLPIPPLNGGHALLELFRRKDEAYGPGAIRAQALGVYILLLLAASWFVAIGYSLLQRIAI
jgi:hypothetical protein